jgi:hypothetical protein
MTTMIRLSTISMIVMESVSEAKASGIAEVRATPPRRRGTIVNE